MKEHIRNEFERIALVPAYYGFLPIEAPSVTKEDEKKAKPFATKTSREKWPNGATWESSLKEKIAILRTYVEFEMHKAPQPILLYFKRPFKGDRKKNDAKIAQFELNVLGSGRAITDALAIQTTFATLHEEGFSSLYLSINSIGDRESIARFSREIEEYYRKHINELSPREHDLLKQSPLALFISKKEEKEVHERAPKPISFLSEPSRKHFMEVLEFVETLEIPYTIDNTLVGDTEYCSHTIFSIREQIGDEPDPEKDTLLAVGARYNQLSRRIGFRKEVAALGIEFFYKRPRGSMGHKKATLRDIPTPKFYFIQLGTEAKLKSLGIIESLRKKGIPICHSITRDKCIGQLSMADSMKTPYVIIMGQKEAVENSALVREAETRSQTTVSLADLPSHLKRIRI